MNTSELKNTVPGRSLPSLGGTLFVSGVLLAILGVFSWAMASIVGALSIMIIGLILFADGIVEIFGAFRLREVSAFTLPFLSGLLSLVVGTMLLVRPLVGLNAVTLLLGAYFLASGLFRGISGLMDRYPQWGWDFVYGAIAFIAGIVALQQLPVTSAWIAGALLGTVLLTRGIAMMAMGAALRRDHRRLAAQR